MSVRLRIFDPVVGHQRRRPVLWGALALGAVTAIVLVVLLKPFAGGGRIVHAHFAPQGAGRFATTPLHAFPDTQVRVRGVTVGTVKDVKPLSGGGVDMALEIVKPGIRVRRDARAHLYYRTLLGRNIYVELEPGHDGRPLGDKPIPARNTTEQVELDQFLGSFQARARQGQKAFFRQFGKGLDTPAVGASIDRAPSALTAAARSAAATRGLQPGTDLPRLLAGGRRTLAALAADEEALAGLLDSGSLAFGVTAARRADLGQIVERSPATLRSTRASMARLRPTLDRLDATATRLRPGVRTVAPALQAATPAMRSIARLVPIALPAFRDLRPALAALRQASQSGAPFLRALQPALQRTATDIVPFLDQRSGTTRLRNYEAIGPFFAAIASSAATFDSGGFMQRFQPGNRNPDTPALPASRCRQASVAGRSRSEIARACVQLQHALDVALLGAKR